MKIFKYQTENFKRILKGFSFPLISWVRCFTGIISVHIILLVGNEELLKVFEQVVDSDWF